MQLFTIPTKENTPEGSRATLENIEKAYGFLPNMYAMLGNVPIALEAYSTLGKLFDKGSLTAKERNLVYLAASVENECPYCVGAHATLAKHKFRLDPVLVDAVKSGTPLPDDKLGALVDLVREATHQRGRLSQVTVDRFLEVGYTREQVLEVLVGLAAKLLTNYLDHVAPVEIEDRFKAEAPQAVES